MYSVWFLVALYRSQVDAMSSDLPLYLDSHATTPVDPRVLGAMLPYFVEVWGNPSSKDHAHGARAREAVETARRSIAAAINARPEEIIFTSGATESNNLALMGVVGGREPQECHIVVSEVEHSSVLDVAAALEIRGVAVTRLSVDAMGRVSPQAVEAAINDQTVLVSIMAANNEIGTLARLKEIGDITRRRGVLFHTDAAQAALYVSLDVRDCQIDLLSLSGHKIYGPKGVGALYVSRRKPHIELKPLLHGGGHEQGMRSGTLNVPGIVGLAAAMDLAVVERQEHAPRLRELTEHMYRRLCAEVGGVLRHGDPDNRLPHNLNVGFDGVRAKSLIVNVPELAFSTGSACTTQKAQPSHVLTAIGLPEDRVREAVRFGLSKTATREQIDFAVDRLKGAVKRLRALGAVVT